MTTWTIVVAAGSGQRFGSDKLLVDLCGTSVIERSLATARSVSDGVVLVWRDEPWTGSEVDSVVLGGEHRSDSVRAGLDRVPDDADVILVHDAARPLATRDLFEAAIDAVHNGADAATPGVPIVDTLKRVDGELILETVDRDDLRAVQTPQAFSAAKLREAHTSAPVVTDDAAAIERIGGRAVCIPGEIRNRKLTSGEDLEIMRAWCA
ncbi:MAG: IspD/TarI family cytidylyltransferase [Acidimicrobiia bacterium]